MDNTIKNNSQEENKPDKGLFNGSCNRTACQKPGALFYNHSTRLYYCPSCAQMINQVNPESKQIYGHQLCTYGEHKEELSQEDLKNECDLNSLENESPEQ